MGVVSPIGNDVASFWASIKGGVCGVGPITSFDLEDLYIHIAAQVKDLDIKEKLSGIRDKTLPHADRYSQLAGIAAIEAMTQSGLPASARRSLSRRPASSARAPVV